MRSLFRSWFTFGVPVAVLTVLLLEYVLPFAFHYEPMFGRVGGRIALFVTLDSVLVALLQCWLTPRLDAREPGGAVGQ